jgi:hypothetical protein
MRMVADLAVEFFDVRLVTDAAQVTRPEFGFALRLEPWTGFQNSLAPVISDIRNDSKHVQSD